MKLAKLEEMFETPKWLWDLSSKNMGLCCVAPWEKSHPVGILLE
jgi:hypothetical protein